VGAKRRFAVTVGYFSVCPKSMSEPSLLCALFTLIAAATQTVRNAAQRELTGKLGTVGATHVRFLFGAPFAFAFLLAVLSTGATLPRPGSGFWPWLLGGALMQIAATTLMLAAMSERSFVVAIAYIKTEPVQVAVFGLLFLGDAVTPIMAGAIVVATAGVIVLSVNGRRRTEGRGGTAGERRENVRRKSADERGRTTEDERERAAEATAIGVRKNESGFPFSGLHPRSLGALLGALTRALAYPSSAVRRLSSGQGLAAGASFALSAIFYRGAILSLHDPNYLMAATFTMTAGLIVQSVLLSLYLSVLDAAVLAAIARAWKPSLFAGFMGALASQFWFLAFALATAASVRTLALVEVLFAQAISRFVFHQPVSQREGIGISLIVAGVVLLLWAY
jgi:drug/metabolite transporter (DMT)-like permease